MQESWAIAKMTARWAQYTVKWVTGFGLNGNGGRGFLAADRRVYGSSPSAWSKGRQPSGAVLHPSREPGELMQWLLSHDDSTINIVLAITIITSGWGIYTDVNKMCSNNITRRCTRGDSKAGEEEGGLYCRAAPVLFSLLGCNELHLLFSTNPVTENSYSTMKSMMPWPKIECMQLLDWAL